MKFFDPPQIKSKPFKRTLYLYPEGINRKLFVWIYFGSIVFWILLILMFVSLNIFLLLPFLGVVISSSYQIILMVVFFIVSIMFGMSMGSRVVNGIIMQGVAEGDVKLQKL